jgi:type IV secretory pathway VirB2 component (pilin)
LLTKAGSQAVCFNFVYGWKNFSRLVVLLVLINTGIQMASFGPEPNSWFRAQNAIDAIFVAFFTIELVLKVGAEKDLRCA